MMHTSDAITMPQKYVISENNSIYQDALWSRLLKPLKNDNGCTKKVCIIDLYNKARKQHKNQSPDICFPRFEPQSASITGSSYQNLRHKQVHFDP